MPTISVIVPVYKVEKFINRCVDSILSQTYTDFQLLLVDDGSPDGCPAICDEYAAKDPRVVVIHQKNGGLSAARNAGIDWAFANSDSKWLTFIDSDDWVHPELLERLLDAALAHNVSVSVCGYAETAGEAPVVTHAEATLWTPEDFFIQHNVNATVAWGKLYRKDCFKTIRYPVGKIHEDEFTTYKILFPLEQVAVLPAPLYFYFTNPNGITKSPWSPKRLDALDALWERAAYFKTKGNPRMLEHTAKGCAQWIMANAVTIKNTLPDRAASRYQRLLRRRMGRLLGTYREVFSFRQNIWLYEFAFPRAMHLYWIGRAAINKAKRLGEK